MVTDFIAQIAGCHAQDIVLWTGAHWLEIFGVVSSLLYIYLEVNLKSSMWVVGFMTSAIYVVVFFQSGLYADSALNVYYVGASIYGMYCWRYARDTVGAAAGRSVSRLRLPLGLALALTVILLYALVGYVLDRFTDSPVPYYDSVIFAFSVVATWMLARKTIEHWYLWIFVNFYSSGLYLWRELYPTSALFVVYGAMSVVGWFRWRQSIHQYTP